MNPSLNIRKRTTCFGFTLQAIDINESHLQKEAHNAEKKYNNNFNTAY